MCVCVCTCVYLHQSVCSAPLNRYSSAYPNCSQLKAAHLITVQHIILDVAHPLLNYNLSHRNSSQSLLPLHTYLHPHQSPFIPISSSILTEPFTPQEFHTPVAHSSPLHRLYTYPLLCVFAAPSPYLLIAIIAQ